jgi:hypothetical protein
MSHWDFLIEKLGKDIVYHCIQPILVPTPKRVKKRFKKVLKDIRKMRYPLLEKSLRMWHHPIKKIVSEIENTRRYRREIASDRQEHNQELKRAELKPRDVRTKLRRAIGYVPKPFHVFSTSDMLKIPPELRRFFIYIEDLQRLWPITHGVVYEPDLDLS